MSITAQAIGNCTRTPELRFTTGGSATCSFGLACTRRYQQNGEWTEQTTFINVVCWGGLAENVAKSVDKGARLVVTGRIDIREYEKEGEKRQVCEIVADEVSPSLKWATAQIDKVERSGPQDRQHQPSRGGSTGNRRETGPLPDEEPFINVQAVTA